MFKVLAYDAVGRLDDGSVEVYHARRHRSLPHVDAITRYLGHGRRGTSERCQRKQRHGVVDPGLLLRDVDQNLQRPPLVKLRQLLHKGFGEVVLVEPTLRDADLELVPHRKRQGCEAGLLELGQERRGRVGLAAGRIDAVPDSGLLVRQELPAAHPLDGDIVVLKGATDLTVGGHALVRRQVELEPIGCPAT